MNANIDSIDLTRKIAIFGRCGRGDPVKSNSNIFSVKQIAKLEEAQENFEAQLDVWWFRGQPTFQKAFEIATNGAKPHGTAAVALMIEAKLPLQGALRKPELGKIFYRLMFLVQDNVAQPFAGACVMSDALHFSALCAPLHEKTNGKKIISINQNLDAFHPLNHAVETFLDAKYKQILDLHDLQESISKKDEYISLLELKNMILQGKCSHYEKALRLAVKEFGDNQEYFSPYGYINYDAA